MELTVIIPVHNEEEIIETTIRDLEEKLNIKHKVIIVIDHCTDYTLDKLKSLKLLYPHLEIVHNCRKVGFANALKVGFEKVKEGVVVPVMADLCDDPCAIIEMYGKIQRGFDIVCGSRYIKGGKKICRPSLQSFFSHFVGLSFHYLTGIPTHDVSNSFKMYRKEVLDRIASVEPSFAVSMEITTRAYFDGFKIGEVPTTWKERSMGKSTFRLLEVAPGYIRWYIWGAIKKISFLFTANHEKANVSDGQGQNITSDH